TPTTPPIDTSSTSFDETDIWENWIFVREESDYEYEPENGEITIGNKTIKADDFLNLLLFTSSYTLRDFRRYLSLEDAAGNILESIHRCTFNDAPCDMNDFKVINDSDYGNCLTYNYNGNKVVRRSGSTEGLQLRLTWNASNQMNLLAPAKGFRVTLHHHKAEPDPLGEGIDVGMDMNSYIGMKKRKFERLRPEDGGDCAYDSYLEDRFNNSIYNIGNGTKYSFQLCQKLCKLQAIRDGKESQCYRKSPLLQETVDKSEYCNKSALHVSLNPSFVSTSQRMVERDRGFFCFREEMFDWSLSTTPMIWENAELMDLIDWLRNENKRTSDTNELRHWTSFIGTLGGLLGLYTGLSFVSVLEVLEWMLDLIIYGWRKPQPDKMGSKQLAVITWNDTLESERWGTKSNEFHHGTNSGTVPVYIRPPLKNVQSAGFDLAFSNYIYS
ncbi:unnamed protein product, partial [Darwinula stevensoni]